MAKLGPRVTEKRILDVSPQQVTSNGTAKGRIQVPNSFLFVVGQEVSLRDNTGRNEKYQVKRIFNDLIFLGEKGKGINHRSNLKHFLYVNDVTIDAEEQERPNIPSDQIGNFTYAEEPIMAQRVVPVDHLGRYNTLSDYESDCQPTSERALNVQQRGPIGWTAMQSFIDKFLSGIEYNQVENNVEDDYEILTFRQNGTIVKELTIKYENCSWFIGDGGVTALDEFMLKEDGDFLLTEGGDKIFIVA